MTDAPVVIVGAGVVGAATALALAERGVGAVVLDTADGPAEGASAANGCQLSWYHTDALAGPAIVSQMPRLAAGRDPAFRLARRADAHMLGWIARFLGQCGAGANLRNSTAVLELAIRSREAMAAWQERHDWPIQYRLSGKIHLFADADAMTRQRGRIALRNRFGAEQRFCDPDELVRIEPALARYGGPLAGGLYSPHDICADPKAFVFAALAAAREVAGTEFRPRTEVTGIVQRRGRAVAVATGSGEIEASAIVVANGAEAVRLARSWGERLAILKGFGYSLTLPAGPAAPEAGITDTSRKIVLCRMGKTVRIAGMLDLGFEAAGLPEGRIDTLRRLAREGFPDAADHDNEGAPWRGARPMTPDSRPICRPAKLDGVVVNAGHGMLGWTLAAATGARAAELAMECRRGPR